jgi:hypothetical protein
MAKTMDKVRPEGNFSVGTSVCVAGCGSKRREAYSTPKDGVVLEESLQAKSTVTTWYAITP